LDDDTRHGLRIDLAVEHGFQVFGRGMEAGD
jgi:hypothetical protein